MKLLTVFTPAYNRAHTLHRTYESLCKQNCKDFIWLIVDDGSTDNTEELVADWQTRENGFEIQYIYKENGGMHTAHNTAYEHIRTELNVCIDSDDKMAPGAVQKIKDTWEKIRERGYAGIIALDADFEGNIIGKGFPKDVVETTLGGYYAAGGAGDKKLVYRTDVIKSVPPYPVFAGEKYVPLSFKYILCDQEYKLYVLNEILCNVEYQEDGSTATMWRQYEKNPKGFSVIRKLDMIYPNTLKKLLIANVHYVSCCFLSQEKNFISKSPRIILTTICLPWGWLLSKYIKFKAHKLEKTV